MTRDKKKDSEKIIRQKLMGDYIVDIIDEKKQEAYLPGVDFEYIKKLYRNKKVKIVKICTIQTPYSRREDITRHVLRQLEES